MKKIISPISRFDLEKELNEETFIRKTNFCNHDIYIVDFKNQRNTSMEIGRLRELTFRNARLSILISLYLIEGIDLKG